VYEDANNFYVQLALPGMEPNQIDVQVENNVLCIKGERKCEPSGEVTWYAHEFPYGPFSCSFRLPSYVDHGKSTASYTQGVLTVMFPKHEEARPRRIMIEGQ
jgi:HSP20 family protein